MTDIVERLRAAKAGQAPHPFPQIGGMRALPTYLVGEDELDELLSAINREEAESLEYWGEINDVARAIGSDRFMDPPDGGNVSIPEQVRRIRSALSEAEKERDELAFANAPWRLWKGIAKKAETDRDQLPAEVDKWIVTWADADASVTKLAADLSEAEKERDGLRLELVVAKTDAEVSADLLAVSTEIAKKAEAERDNLENVVEDFSSNIDHARELTRQLAARAEKAEAELAQARRVIETVASYAWRPDPPHASGTFTEAERFGAIKHHPEIKRAALITDTGHTEGERG